MHRHHGITTPIQQGYQKDYYDKGHSVYAEPVFPAGFKDNQHLSLGLLTGILRVVGGIFSGMNSLFINSVLDNNYSALGLPPARCWDSGILLAPAIKYGKICQWYGGYRFVRGGEFSTP